MVILTLLFGNAALAQRGESLSVPLGENDIVVDNAGTDPTTGTVAMTPGTNPSTGADVAWGTSSNNAASNYGSDRHQINNGYGATFQWTPVIPQSGYYAVYVTFHGTTGRANPVPYEIYHGGVSTIVNVNQSSSSNSNGYWFGLETGDANAYFFEKGTGNYVKIHTLHPQTDAWVTGWVMADAVRLVPLSLLDDDASLSGLSVAPEPSAGFHYDPALTSYSFSVFNSVYSMDIVPTVSSSVYRSLTINGVPAVSGSPHTAFLATGLNQIPIAVTAEDGITVQTYTLQVTRLSHNGDLSNDANLGSLQISPGLLAFDPAVTYYSLTVGSQVESVDLIPAASAAEHKQLSINGVPVVSGAPYTVQLSSGPNIVSIEVTAEDDTEKIYTLEVFREHYGNDSSLSRLDVSRGTLEFDPDVTEYTVYVDNSAAHMELTPVAASPLYKSLSINGEPAVSGEAYTVDLAPGRNTVSIAVTAPDDTRTVYNVHVIKRGNAAPLSGLDFSHGTLPFSPWRTAYSVYVGNGISAGGLTPAVDSPYYESITINGSPHAPGSSYTAALAVGSNPVAVEVASKDGTKLVYTIDIHRLDSAASAKTVNGRVMLPVQELASALGVHLLQDDSGLAVFSKDLFDFSGEGDAALERELADLLKLRLTVNGRTAEFFKPAVKNYRLLLNGDASIPEISLEAADGAGFTVEQAQHADEPTVLTIDGRGVYTFHFAADSYSSVAPPELAAVKLQVEGEEAIGIDPTWIPIESVLSNDGYANVNTPEKTIDNDLGTRWSTTSAGETKWLLYDFGKEVQVHSMAAAGYMGDTRAYNFEVEISDDGESFTQIRGMQNTSGTTLLPELFPLEDVKTRYIRLMCYGYSSSKSGWNGFSDIRFYDSQAQADLDQSKWGEYFAPKDSFKAGDTVKLAVKGVTAAGTEFPLDPSAAVVFGSSNPALAQVDQEGNVALNAQGDAKINVMVKQGKAVRMSSITFVIGAGS
jgi:hypothetical protein